MRERDKRQVWCPRCGVPAGVPCQTLTGDGPAARSHRERRLWAVEYVQACFAAEHAVWEAEQRGDGSASAVHRARLDALRGKYCGYREAS